MKSKWLKGFNLTMVAIAITLGVMAYTSVRSLVYWNTETVEVTGNQIAKRLENTRYGDRFYLLVDSKYGVMEIPVSYNLYLSSSNDEQHSFRIKLKTADYALEDTHILQEDYPILGWILALTFLWVGSAIAAVGILLSWGITFNRWLGLDLAFMLSGVLWALI